MKRLPRRLEIGVYIPTLQGGLVDQDFKGWKGLMRLIYTIFWNVLMSKIRPP